MHLPVTELMKTSGSDLGTSSSHKLPPCSQLESKNENVVINTIHLGIDESQHETNLRKRQGNGRIKSHHCCSTRVLYYNYYQVDRQAEAAHPTSTSLIRHSPISSSRRLHNTHSLPRSIMASSGSLPSSLSLCSVVYSIKPSISATMLHNL
jgi:hypothetical protein